MRSSVLRFPYILGWRALLSSMLPTMCFHLPGLDTSEHNVPSAVIIQSPVRSHHRGRFCWEVNAISIHISQTTEALSAHLSIWMEFLADKERAPYTVEIMNPQMRSGDFWTPGFIPQMTEKMEGVACVKMKPIQKRHSAAVRILNHRELVVQFSVLTVAKFWVSSKTQYIRWLSLPSGLRGWLHVW